MIELYVLKPGEDGSEPSSHLVATCPDLRLASRAATALYACYGREIEVRQMKPDGSCNSWITRSAAGSPTRAQICRAALACRNAQRRYFRTRLPADLVSSKQFEVALDKLLDEYETGPPVLELPQEQPAEQLSLNMGVG